jgi:hypothetical protein
VVYNMVIGQRVASADRGRAYATFTGAVQGTSMVGYFAGGLLLRWVRPRPLVARTGLVGVLTAALFVVPARRSMEREPVNAVEPGHLR